MTVFGAAEACTAVDPNPEAPCNVLAVPYAYVPTEWVNIVFLALHCLLFIAHIDLARKNFRKGGFMLLAAVCAAGELAGWASRLRSSFFPFDVNAYISQMVVLILSPVFISAANYVALERIIATVGHEFSRIPPKLYLILFISGDVISLILQAIGGGGAATANTYPELDRGTNIMIAGVSVQVAVTVPFLLLFLDFHIRHYLHYLNSPAEEKANSVWTRSLVLLSGASIFSTLMILTRCIYRVIEMAQGWRGHLATTEVYFDVLDGLVIFLAVAIFVPFHPSFLLPTSDLTKDHQKGQLDEEKAQEKAEADEQLPAPTARTPSSSSTTNDA